MRAFAARRSLGVLLALALASLPATGAWGWGAEGHRIVGAVAEALLDARTRDALAEIAGDRRLSEIGLFLDRDREELESRIPGSSRWHYDNRPDCTPEVPRARYCPRGDCASAAFEKYRAILADRHASRDERFFALEVVVHVLADVHQPLHVADHDDRGGNDLKVLLGPGRHPKPLHGAWDNDFVRRAMAGERQAAFVAGLIAEYGPERDRIAAGRFTDWTQESWQLAHDFAFGRLPGFSCGAADPRVVALPEAYADGAARIVREQLARAGIRLAAVLKASL